MRIEKLELKGFGKFNNFSLTLHEGLNVIYGSNEAGKTTIQAFVKGMLFGLKGGRTAKDGTIPPAKKYKPWKATDYNGFMEYRLDNGKVYRVGRNFATGSVRIFDHLFNDITDTFEANKERGPQFAEKHIGINEACFDKTVFIKQMELKVDEDGSKELLNRLMNVAQTGFEDISFRRAEKALKEAMKSYVGTDKTSTRPLDKIIARIEELQLNRDSLAQKRDRLQTSESELRDLSAERDSLEYRKDLLTKLKKVVELKKSLEESTVQRNELAEILDKIKSAEDELKLVSSRIEGYNRECEEYALFSEYSEDDANDLSLKYYRLLSLAEESKKLKDDIQEKTQEQEKIKSYIGSLSAFQSLSESVENTVIDTKQEIEKLKQEYDKGSVDVLTEKIKNAESKNKRTRYNIVAAVVLTLIFSVIGLVGMPMSFIAAATSFVGVLVLLFTNIGASKQLSVLKSEKAVSFISLNRITEEMNQRLSALEKIFETVGAKSVEEFFKLKSEYDAKNKQQKAIEQDIVSLEKKLSEKSRGIAIIKEELLKKLISTNILQSEATDVDEDHVKRFKYGISRYKGLKPSINYAQQRITHLNSDIETLYKRAVVICKCDQKAQLDDIVSRMTDEINSINEKITSAVNELTVRGDDIESLLNSTPEEVERNYNKASEGLNDTLLKIKELETIIKTTAGDSEEIQKIDEEMEELKLKKQQLEEIGTSLNTALEVLTEASLEIQRDYVPALNSRMSDIIRRISGGRYNDIRADDNLCLKALSPETGDVVATPSLSGGTVDQIYLSMRLAMSELVALSGEGLPLIIDEAFAQYDDSRTTQTLELFRELAEERQVILFTCKRREVDIAKEVCGDKVNVMELS